MPLDLARAIQGEQSRVLGELVGRKAIDRVLDVSTRIDLLAFESPEFYDRLQRARAQGQYRALQTVNGLLGIVGSLVTAVAIVFALATLQPLLLPFVLIGYLPLWVVASLNTRDLYHYTRGMTPNDRQRSYLQNVLMGRNAAKEVRAFNLAGFLRRRYDTLYDERIAELRKLAKRRTGRALLGSVTSSAVTVGTIAMLAWLYTTDRMSLAAAGAAVFGLYQLANQLRGLHMSATSLYEATLFIRDYSSFLTLEPSVEEAEGRTPAPKSFDRLTVEDVSLHLSGVGPPGRRRRLARDRQGRDHRARRRERVGQDHAREDARRACTGPRPGGSAGTTSTSRTWTPTSSAGPSP